MSLATLYKWRSKYSGMDASMISRLKELEDENRRLKKMYAEERLKAEIIQEAMAKIPIKRGRPSGKAVPAPRNGAGDGEPRKGEHSIGLLYICRQRDLLSLSAQAEPREQKNRRLADQVDPQPTKLGFWTVLFISSQCKGLPLEPQAGLPHIPGIGAQFAYQT